MMFYHGMCTFKMCTTVLIKNIYLLQQIKQFLPIDSRKLFFNIYILPHLTTVVLLGEIVHKPRCTILKTYKRELLG